MDEDNILLVGYHGTKSYFRKSIENYGFKESLSGWLGRGVYFFQEDYKLSKEWATKKYKTPMVCYLQRKIEVDKKYFFDITWPLSDNSKYFFEERKKYVEEMEKRGYKVEIDSRKRFEGKLIDLICSRKEYKVVRACTYTYQEFDEIYKLDSIFANGVEICVKDHNCIKKGM